MSAGLEDLKGRGPREQMHALRRAWQWFSKKAENHVRIAIDFLHYDFARIHKTLSATPVMEAGLTMHVWSIEEIVGLFKDWSSGQ